MRYSLYILLLLFVACKEEKKPEVNPQVKSELPPFWNDIQNFKKQDSINPPPKHAILFIGSSSFTKWTDVQNYFPDYTIINRGFGGSTLLDQIRYVNDIVFPYEPKQIVIYCGENDLASSDTVASQMVVDRFKQLYQIIRKKTSVPFEYISMKPSPSRRYLLIKMREANILIKAFIRSHRDGFSGGEDCEYIDVHSKMLNTNGEPIPEIFLEDSLHMNAKGYAIWQKEIQPYLLKD
jgi:lysophospholipase L1-like esterase